MNSMKYNAKTFSFFLASVFFLSTSLHGITVVTISMHEIATNSETGKSMSAKIQAKQQSLNQTLQEEGKKITDLEKKLIAEEEKFKQDVAAHEKSKGSMSDEARSKKQDELTDRAVKIDSEKRNLEVKIQQFQRKAQEAEKTISDMYQKEMAKLQNLTLEAVKTQATKNGWDIVIPQESVLFVNPTFSETAKVSAEIDAKTKAALQAKKQDLEAKRS